MAPNNKKLLLLLLLGLAALGACDPSPGYGGPEGGRPEKVPTPQVPAPAPEYPGSSPQVPTSGPEYPGSSPKVPTSGPEYPGSSPKIPAPGPEYPTSTPEGPESQVPVSVSEYPPSGPNTPSIPGYPGDGPRSRCKDAKGPCGTPGSRGPKGPEGPSSGYPLPEPPGPASVKTGIPPISLKPTKAGSPDTLAQTPTSVQTAATSTSKPEDKIANTTDQVSPPYDSPTGKQGASPTAGGPSNRTGVRTNGTRPAVEAAGSYHAANAIGALSVSAAFSVALLL